MVDAVPLQSDFGRYIINDGAKTRRRDRREDKRRLACEEAVTKSRLSYHMVKFENSNDLLSGSAEKRKIFLMVS